MKYYLIGEVVTAEGEHTEVLNTSSSMEGIIKKTDSLLEGYLGAPRLTSSPNLRIIEGSEIEISIVRHAFVSE